MTERTRDVVGLAERIRAIRPRLIYGPLACVPLAALVTIVSRHQVDAPYLDDWELAVLLSKLKDHALTFRDLWAQHNEHRLVISQTVMLVLARLTSWNLCWQMGLSIAVAIAAFVVFMRQVELTGEALGTPRIALVGPAVAVLFFSLVQYQNWMWGWQLHMFLSVFAVLGAIVLLANGPFRRWKLVAAMGLGLVATYSFANGQLIWPIGALLVALAPHFREHGRWMWLGAWAAVGAVAVGAYFVGYTPSANRVPLSYALTRSLDFAEYVFCYLGRPASKLPYVALGAGLAITLVTAASLIILVRLRRVSLATLLPYLALCAYVFASAVLTALGRVKMGPGQALSSRYTTYTILLWSCALVLLALVAFSRADPIEDAAPSKQNMRGRRQPEGGLGGRRAVALAAVATMLGIVIQTAWASFDQRPELVAMGTFQSSGRAQLLRYLSPAATPLDRRLLLYPDGDKMVERARFLQREHLSLFRDDPGR